ncbi:MAG: hypothetical protein M1820_004325 [Bogoriella megaspora]|nr:MAG: hypothetical protein M1820_004325 [Bogoriella megaspora]
MKYGQTLRQRSIPEWSHYNVDYDDIKQLIKDRTTPGCGQALSIPGQGQRSENDFEEVLFGVLTDQHQRINLFVRSKIGEIDRRLARLEDQTRRLNIQLRTVRATKVTAKRLVRYGKLENDVLRAGNEIQSLSRFIGVQRLAFAKLLKKYRKWTNSDTLENRFIAKFNRPESFSKVDLGVLLGRWAEALQEVRAPFQPGFFNSGVSSFTTDRQTRKGSAKNSSREEREEHKVTSLIHSAITKGSALDFDIALATMPVDVRSREASFWVHNDDIVELQILLLQHLQLFSPSATGSPWSSSPSSERSPLNSSATSLPLDGVDDFNIVICEDVDYISTEPVKGADGVYVPTAVRVSIRYGLNEQAVVSLKPATKLDNRDLISTKVRTKHVGRFLNTEVPFQRRDSSEASISAPCETNEGKEIPSNKIRAWLSEHQEVKPLTGNCSKRTRFTALDQSLPHEMWATLDRDIDMCRVELADFSKISGAASLRQNSQRFQHAVLYVRQQGEFSGGLIEKLDQSHLVERVQGFSLEVHSIWACCRPKSMRPPHWLSKLEGDIRKVPSAIEQQRRRSRASLLSTVTGQELQATIPSVPRLEHAESSETAVSLSEGKPSSAAARLKEVSNRASRNKKRRSFLQANQRTQNDPKRRYWNEYDDPEDGNEDDAYVIWVDPNSESSLKKWFGNLMPSWRRAVKDEDKQLLTPGDTTEVGDDSSSTSSDSSKDARTSRVYNTFVSSRDQKRFPKKHKIFNHFFRPKSHSRKPSIARAHGSLTSRLRDYDPESLASNERTVATHERIYSLLTFLSFAASIAILTIIAVLAATGRHKQAYEVDGGIIFGIVVNLISACIGLAALLRSRRTSSAAWVLGFAVFAAVCVGNGALFAWVVSW